MAGGTSVAIGIWCGENDGAKIVMSIANDGTAIDICMGPEGARHLAGQLLLNAQHVEDTLKPATDQEPA